MGAPSGWFPAASAAEGTVQSLSFRGHRNARLQRSTFSRGTTPRATKANSTNHINPLMRKNRKPASPKAFNVSIMAIGKTKVGHVQWIEASSSDTNTVFA